MNEFDYFVINPTAGPSRPPSILATLWNRFTNMFTSDRDQRSLAPRESTPSVTEDLRKAGLSDFQCARRDSRHIGYYIRPTEHIRAAIRGHEENIGSVLIAATDTRVVYLHDMPLYSNFEEFPYDSISALSINKSGNLCSVDIFTRFKTYAINFVSTGQAEHFVAFVEAKIYTPVWLRAYKTQGEAPMKQPVQ